MWREEESLERKWNLRVLQPRPLRFQFSSSFLIRVLVVNIKISSLPPAMMVCGMTWKWEIL